MRSGSTEWIRNGSMIVWKRLTAVRLAPADGGELVVSTLMSPPADDSRPVVGKCVARHATQAHGRSVTDADLRIEALTERLATLERRTADELATIRAELADLRGIPTASAPTAAPPDRPARRDL